MEISSFVNVMAYCIQTTDQERPIVDGVRQPPELKIEIPANRYHHYHCPFEKHESNSPSYDMLCIEGIAMNLNVFLERQAFPDYKLRAPADGKLQTMIVHESVSGKSV